MGCGCRWIYMGNLEYDEANQKYETKFRQMFIIEFGFLCNVFGLAGLSIVAATLGAAGIVALRRRRLYD